MRYISILMLAPLLSFGNASTPIQANQETNLTQSAGTPTEEELILSAMVGIETFEVLESIHSSIEEVQEQKKLDHHLNIATKQIQEAPIPYIPDIEYREFKQAKALAIKEHKYLLVKVEASNCHPCSELNEMLEHNNHIKKMVNQHTKAVKINTDHEALPSGLNAFGTPTVFLIEPEENRIVMKLQGRAAIDELEESLTSFVDEGFREGIALR